MASVRKKQRRPGWGSGQGQGRSYAAACLLAAVTAMTATAHAAPHEAPARARPKQAQAAAPAAVPLTSQPGTPLDRTARRLLTRDMADSSRAERTLVLVGSAQLGPAGSPAALFVQAQSAGECGSAGCSTSVYIGDRKVLDSVSGKIVVDAAQHRGMRDLLVGENERYVWNGTAYASATPAPAVNLHPRTPPRAQPHAHPRSH